MNKYIMFITVRRPHDLCTKHAVETFLQELTAKTDITAVRNEDSMGSFLYYDVTTDLTREAVSREAHAVLNDFGTETGAWYDRGNVRMYRRYLIFRCSVHECFID